MNKLAIVAVLSIGLGIGSLASVQAKLPPAPAMSDADKAAKAAADAAGKAAAAEQLNRAMDKAVANYKKNKGIAMDAKPAAPKAAAK